MKTVLNIKTDRDVKKQAQELANEFGLSLSAVVNMYLKQFIRNQEIKLSTAPKMTPMLEQLIGRALSDYRHGKNISPAFSSEEEIKNYLSKL